MVFKAYALSTEKPGETVKWPQYAAGLSAAGGAFAVGAALGWPAPSSSRLVIKGGSDDRYFEISANQFDWAASIISIGCAISCLPIGILMNKFGRKWTMITLVIPFIVGWALVIWAQNFIMLMFGRFIIGLAGGAFCVSAPQYSSEIAEKEVRGIVGTFFQVLINGGILFVYVIGAYVSVFWTSIICAIVPLLFGVIFFFMPESPVYFVAQNREADANKSYKWLRGNGYDPQAEIDDLKHELAENTKSDVSAGTILQKKSTQRALWIGFGLMLFQQLSGINIVIFYSTDIFAAAQTDIDADIQTIIVGAVLLVATLLGTFLVDRLGRKVLLIISSALMCLMLVALGVYFFLLESNPADVQNLSWLPITSLSIFLVAFSIGYGPIPWLMLSEIYSKDYNAIAGPISGAFNWLLAFAITVSFRYMTAAIGTGPTFWVFAGLTFIGLLFTILVVIETKAKSMADIQRILGGEKIVHE